MAQQPEARHVGGAQRAVHVHEPRGAAVQPPHAATRQAVRAPHLGFAHAAGPLLLGPLFRLVQPLVAVDRQLRAQRLGQHQHAPGARVDRPNHVALSADGHGDAADDGPRVEHRLAARHARARFGRRVGKAANHVLGDNVPQVGRHVARGGQRHQHRVAARHAQAVQIAQHVGTRDAALQVRVFHQRIEEVGRGHEPHALAALERHDAAVHAGPAAVVVLAEALQQPRQLLLRHLAPSSCAARSSVTHTPHHSRPPSPLSCV